MNQSRTCDPGRLPLPNLSDQPGDGRCGPPAGCDPGGGLAPVTLAGSLERFHREAQAGRFDNGRYLCPYYVWGEGPPLIFIHGLADDAYSFVMPISILSSHFRCIAYDLPNGDTDLARLRGYRARHYVQDVHDLLDHLGVGQAYVYGSSFGSTIAMQALHDRPGRFPRAVLQGAFAHRPLAATEVVLAKFSRYWPGYTRWFPFTRNLLERVHYPAFQAREPEVWSYYLQRMGRPPIAAVASRALVLTTTDLRPLLPEIRQPILLVVGDKDPLVPVECADVLERGLPNTARVEFADCGHLPYFTHPEPLAEVMRRFLTPGAE